MYRNKKRCLQYRVLLRLHSHLPWYSRPALVLACAVSLCACDGMQPWNNPYPIAQAGQNIYYTSFSERPKHLDPAVAYSANEYVFIGQVYEPPLQYHFLHRPYRLVPLTATAIPVPEYLGANGQVLAAPPVGDDGAVRVRYRIRIREDVRFQPHPALARDAAGTLRYHALDDKALESVHELGDFAHTGTRPLYAADYIYQIKRLAHPDVHSPLSGLMARYILGMEELASELRKAREKAAPGTWLDLRQYSLAGVRSVDAYTYDIILKEWYPQFIYWLAMPFFSPMPWEADRFYAQQGLAARNISLDWYPIGTGPFMLTENNPNRRMVLQRNPYFRGETYPQSGEETSLFLADAGKPIPFIDQAIFSLEKESIPAWNKFLQGYYDVSGIISDSFDQAVQFSTTGEAELTLAMRSKGITLQTAVRPSIFYLGFNMRDEIVGGQSDRARFLRRAIAIAVDYEEYIAIFANGRGVAAQGPLPPGIFGYQTGKVGTNSYVYRWDAERGHRVRRSIDEARDFLAQAGYPGGRDRDTGKALILYLDTAATGPGARAGFDWMRKQFAKLGINLQVRATDYNRFQDKMRNGAAQLYQWGWNADYPDPENFFFLLYGPNAEVENQGKNVSNYSNPDFDALFVRMVSMHNSPERRQIIDQMVEILRRDSPWLWGMHPIQYVLHHSWYGNAKPNLMANNTLKYKRIDPTERDALRSRWNRPIWPPLMFGCLLMAVAICFVVGTWRKRQQAAPEDGFITIPRSRS